MSIAAIPTLFPDAANPAANAQETQAAQPTLNPQADTIQLTVAERVNQLYNQGQRVSQIAEALSLSVATVNSYLNITNQAA